LKDAYTLIFSLLIFIITITQLHVLFDTKAGHRFKAILITENHTRANMKNTYLYTYKSKVHSLSEIMESVDP